MKKNFIIISLLIAVCFTGCTNNKNNVTLEDTDVTISEQKQTPEQENIDSLVEISTKSSDEILPYLEQLNDNVRITFVSPYFDTCVVEKVANNHLYSFTRHNSLEELEQVYAIDENNTEYLCITNETGDTLWVCTELDDTTDNCRILNYVNLQTPIFEDIDNVELKSDYANCDQIEYSFDSHIGNKTFNYTVTIDKATDTAVSIKENFGDEIEYTYEKISSVSTPREAYSAASISAEGMLNILSVGFTSEYTASELVNIYGNDKTYMEN